MFLRLLCILLGREVGIRKDRRRFRGIGGSLTGLGLIRNNINNSNSRVIQDRCRVQEGVEVMV